jgi:hypothetical protein
MPTMPIYRKKCYTVPSTRSILDLTGNCISNRHQGRMQCRCDTPNDSVAYETSQTKREEIAHESSMSQFSKCNHGSHSSRHSCHLSSGLLPRRERHGLYFLLDYRWCWRWRGHCTGWRFQDVSIVNDERSAHNFIVEIESKLPISSE